MKTMACEKGFSLVEVIVAMSIFAIGLLAVAAMQLSSVTGNFSARNASESVSLAQEKVNELFFRPYNHADLVADLDGDGNFEIEMTGDLDGDGTLEDDDVHTQVVNSLDGNYTFRWVIEEDVALPNTKTITLDVQYSGRGQMKESRLIAVKADVI